MAKQGKGAVLNNYEEREEIEADMVGCDLCGYYIQVINIQTTWVDDELLTACKVCADLNRN